MSKAEPGTRAEIEPLDQHNRQLLANVRPAGWENPRPRGRYHLVVIGAGTGGLVTAAIAARLGARVALVERHLMGGDCLNVGCVPSKSLIAAARAWRDAADAARAFAGPRTVGTGDFGAVMERMRRLRAQFSPIDSAARFRDLGVDVFLGHARFTGRDSASVDGAALRFHRAVIATGGRPAVPPVPGLDRAGFLTNETVFNLTEAPKELVVLGGGAIGCELGQALARLGVRVTIVEQGTGLLPAEDPDAGRIVQAALERDGVRLFLGGRATRVEVRGGRRVVSVERDGRVEEASGDAILVAAGRAANVEHLGLEEAGVRIDRSGIVVDDRLRTSNPRIHAVGDVCSPHKFTHVADAHARIVVGNALFFGLGGGRVSRLVIPRVTYTSPEVAQVGLGPREAEEEGETVRTITVPLPEVDRAALDGQDDGFLRVHLAGRTDRILGATLVAEHAGEMIGELTVAMTSKLGLARVGAAIHPYPTQAEVFRKAADAWRRDRLTPGAKRVFEWWFRLVGRERGE